MDSFIIECPECGIRLEIDRRTGKVINKFPKPDISSSKDPLMDMIKKTKENKEKLDDYFGKAKENMDKKIKELDKHFEESKKKAKDDPSKPINPMDLD
jgi:ABC-type enterochelin transport system substrate-binding protein